MNKSFDKKTTMKKQIDYQQNENLKSKVETDVSVSSKGISKKSTLNQFLQASDHFFKNNEKTEYSQQSAKSSILSQSDYNTSKGESVKVCLRIRPMNKLEQQRGDQSCINILSQTVCEIKNQNFQKQAKFNYLLDQNITQQDVFQQCKIQDLLASALDGYSATIFAYGQTGSGKTFTMAGNEEALGQEHYQSDTNEGLIPRSFQKLWQLMSQNDNQYFIKASFCEIYNEQLFDLLNPQKGILQVRWNSQNGFFVQDQMIVECSDVNDLVAVLNEGIKNRKIGSHELNKDSSRSHSILTIYVISEMVKLIKQKKGVGENIKKYGKLSFVDLAGSERLKESKAKGDMIKETGNINKSLFTLGKVISCLTEKKVDKFIPYRDSKLTMLLMDSLGFSFINSSGKSKTMMIACISPSMAYFDETLSTIQYAMRTMNIKNKPIIQMETKDQIIYNLNQEIKICLIENQFLRQQINKINNGGQPELDQISLNSQKQDLPPLKNVNKTIQERNISTSGSESMDIPINQTIKQLESEMQKIQQDNQNLRNQKELSENNYYLLMNENNVYQIKLQNLENLFVGNPIQKEVKNNSIYEDENESLKDRIKILMNQNNQLVTLINKSDQEQNYNKKNQEMTELIQENEKLSKQIDYLAHRESDLLQKLEKTN